MPGSSPATDFSIALLAELVTLGVRDIVVSPGSRSQALALAAAEFERRGLLSLHVRIDERVAGFLALGLAVESGLPVAVVTTSGTAVANLHPAVLEAHHSGVPLLLLTADRPAELRGIGSNQTTVQPGIFASAVAFARDIEVPDSATSADYPAQLALEAFSAAVGHSCPAGPVHLNLAFREPLSASIDRHATIVTNPETQSRLPGVVGHPPVELEPRPGTIVIAGHAAGPGAEELARALGAPLLAEVSSGARFGPNLVVAYREVLSDPGFAAEVRRAVVFGHPTLSREIPALLMRTDVETVVVRGQGAEAYNPGRRASAIVGGVRYSGEPAERSWAGRWVAASRALLDSAPVTSAGSRTLAQEQLEIFRQPVTRRMLVEAVWGATWPHDRLVLGASRLIREADKTVPGRKITVHANRGLAGIDGTIATATGIALAAEAEATGGVTRVLIGDLTLLHDSGALLFGRGEQRPALQVIVGNDGGGTIFDGLEVATTAGPDAVDRVLYTPQSVDLRALATAYGWEYRVARNRGELDEALAPAGTPTLVEVPLARR